MHTFCCANNTMTAASADAKASAAHTFSQNIALMMDAIVLASIFVAAVIVSLLGSSTIISIVISIILVAIIVLLVTASSRYGEPT